MSRPIGRAVWHRKVGGSNSEKTRALTDRVYRGACYNCPGRIARSAQRVTDVGDAGMHIRVIEHSDGKRKTGLDVPFPLQKRPVSSPKADGSGFELRLSPHAGAERGLEPFGRMTSLNHEALVSLFPLMSTRTSCSVSAPFAVSPTVHAAANAIA